MTPRTPLPAFEHDPLPEHTSHFRLLQIIRGDFGQHVECEISAWPIDNAPPYFAISYTWGDSADTAEITVNGRPLVVRRNCEYVLQQAFASNSSKYFWVDAICIAQTTEEKNHQVGIMGKIYSEARHVLACVGPHENDSEFLPEAIQECRSLITKIRMERMPWDELWRNPITKSKRLYARCTFHIKTEIRRRIYQSFCSFMRRSYFRRLWIIQELHLARHVAYCFGTAIEEAEDLLALYQLLSIWADNDLYLLSLPARLLTTFARSSLARSRAIASLATESTFSDIYQPSTCLQFACRAEKQEVKNILLDPGLQCSDPRDRLFGILSVVNLQPKDVPKPDYTKDRFEVALDALKLIYKSSSYNYHRFYTKELCYSLQITGEEPSLRRAINLRAGRPARSALSTNDGSSYFKEGGLAYTWSGIPISRTTEDSMLSGLSYDYTMNVSVQEQQDHCTLMFNNGSNTTLISAPLGTKHGDWWLFTRVEIGRKVPSIGLIVRPSESGSYKLIGPTYPVIIDEEVSTQLLIIHTLDRFIGSWYLEDLLFLGWTIHELELHKTTQDRTIEFVNRQICAWDGSSYFQKRDKPEYSNTTWYREKWIKSVDSARAKERRGKIE